MAVQGPVEAVRAMVDAFYEPGATLVPQQGQVASGEAAIREAMGGRTTDVARRRPDGTWRWVIDVPFGIG